MLPPFFCAQLSLTFGPMNVLSVNQLGRRLGERVLFDQLSFGLSLGEKAALIGANGVGKSTLIKIITGNESADAGDFAINKEVDYFYLPQDGFIDPDLEAYAAVASLLPKLDAWRNQYNQCLETGDEISDELMHKMDHYKLWDWDTDIEKWLSKLEVPVRGQKVGTFSGGQSKRVFLVAMVLSEAAFLILDEPTNHLDIPTVEWLESYLSAANKTILLVSHDRYFLDSVCKHILEMEQHRIFHHVAGYQQFLQTKAERELKETSEWEKAKNKLRKELDWMRRQPKARSTKAKYRVDAFYDLEKQVKSRTVKSTIELEVEQQRLGGKILEFHRVSKAFGDKNILDDFSFVFQKQERIGIIGPNGAGKSTLVHLMTGKIEPDAGTIERGVNTKFGLYTQQELIYTREEKVLDKVLQIAEFVTLADGSTISAGQLLQRFLFSPSRQYDFIYKLSGGEKRRLQLLMVLIQNPNFLILDEPTNDLDLETIQALEDFLETFGGCLIVISHDRFFLDKLCEHVFVLEGNASVQYFPGNYTDWQAYQKELNKMERQAVTPPSASASVTIQQSVVAEIVVPKVKLSFKEKKEMEDLEVSIKRMQTDIAEFEAKLGANATDFDQIKLWSESIAELKSTMDKAELRLLELMELVG